MSAPLSTRHPLLFWIRAAQLRTGRRIEDARGSTAFASHRRLRPLPCPLGRHASPLRRRLGAADPALDEAKIANLRLAVASIDGLLLAPGEVFSFWRAVGAPSRRRGYRDGLVLWGDGLGAESGGGLCQLASLLYWLALVSPSEIVEHHHHGFDAFPDEGRTQPFGSGATVFYNYVDLRVRNPGPLTLQLLVSVTEDELIGEIRADGPWPEAYAIEERGHRYVRGTDGAIYRENELWRIARTHPGGEPPPDAPAATVLREELIARNRARVRYEVDERLVEDEPPPG